MDVRKRNSMKQIFRKQQIMNIGIKYFNQLTNLKPNYQQINK